MKRLFLVLFLSCLGSLFCFSQTIYVSSSTGNSLYDGTSIDFPTNDLKKAVQMGKTVLLKAGDVFFVGNLSISDITLSRYGEGTNPVICGFKRIIDPRWKEVERNIWRLNLAEDNYTGIVLNGSSTSNNICAFHDFENDLIYGRKVWHKDEMNADWDFWQTETLSNGKPEEYDYVYLYLEVDPTVLTRTHYIRLGPSCAEFNSRWNRLYGLWLWYFRQDTYSDQELWVGYYWGADYSGR